MIMQECDHSLARGTGSSGEETRRPGGGVAGAGAHRTPTPHHTHHLSAVCGPTSQARVTCYSYMLVVRIAVLGTRGR